MTTTSKNARVAGFLYLLLLIGGPLRLIYIPRTMFVDGNAAATVRNIAAHEGLFRLGVLTDLFAAVVLVLVTLALYRLFKGVDRGLAVMLVILGGVMPATLYFVNVVHDLAALMIVHGADYLSVFDKPQRDALAMLFLDLHDRQNVAAEILWGVWLIPFAILVYRSRFLPRFLGVWLVINGIAYVAMSVTGVMAPQHADLVFRIGTPARLGEVVTLFWLLIMGAREPRPAKAAAA